MPKIPFGRGWGYPLDGGLLATTKSPDGRGNGTLEVNDTVNGGTIWNVGTGDSVKSGSRCRSRIAMRPCAPSRDFPEGFDKWSSVHRQFRRPSHEPQRQLIEKIGYRNGLPGRLAIEMGMMGIYIHI